MPHFQPVQAKLFVTFRLAGTLPRHVIDRLKQEREIHISTSAKIENSERRREAEYLFQKRLFAKYDEFLDNAKTGPVFLSQPAIAQMVYDSILLRDKKLYNLDACSIMPNHVHMVFQPLDRGVEPHGLSKIMHSLKRYTAQEANKLLSRTGQFWQHEYYDHFIRDEDELTRIIRYVLFNPVKAGLVDKWRAWPWNYCVLETEN